MLRLLSCFRRAKEKRLKKDAGRTRWSQYFRSMKGGSSPRHEKLHDKDDKMDLESNFSHTHGKTTFSTCSHLNNNWLLP
jgi:LIM homeobox protein 3/4